MSDTHETTEDQLIEARRSKHEAILEGGGYPHRFERTDVAADLQEAHQDLEPSSETDVRASVAGRLLLHRSFGKLQFGTLQDETGTIQLFVERNTIGEEGAESFSDLDLGDWVGASGLVMTTKKGELSIKVEELTLLQKSLRPLPDKYHGLHDIELRSRRRYLDLLVNSEAREVAVARAKIVSQLRKEFEARGYIEVDTPVLLHQATGANARPFVTEHNALDMEMYLRIATELYLKRLVIGGLGKVFEIGRIFRNEGVDSTHNPEFTMLESYEAFADYQDIMRLVEEVISSVTAATTGSTAIEYQGRELDLSVQFRRVTVM